MCLGMLCYLFWFSFCFAEYTTILIFVTYNAYQMQIQTSCLHPHVVLFLLNISITFNEYSFLLSLTRFPKEKLHTLDSVQDGLLVLRMISTHKTGQLTIQQNRSHVLAESITYELTSPEVSWPAMSVRTAVKSRVFILLALHEFDTNRVATNLENRGRSGENIFDKKVRENS